MKKRERWEERKEREGQGRKSGLEIERYKSRRQYLLQICFVFLGNLFLSLYPSSNNIGAGRIYAYCLLIVIIHFPYAYETQDRVFEGMVRVAFNLFHEGNRRCCPGQEIENWIKSLIVNPSCFLKWPGELSKLLYPDLIPEKLNRIWHQGLKTPQMITTCNQIENHWIPWTLISETPLHFCVWN